MTRERTLEIDAVIGYNKNNLGDSVPGVIPV